MILVKLLPNPPAVSDTQRENRESVTVIHSEKENSHNYITGKFANKDEDVKITKAKITQDLTKELKDPAGTMGIAQISDMTDRSERSRLFKENIADEIIESVQLSINLETSDTELYTKENICDESRARKLNNDMNAKNCGLSGQMSNLMSLCIMSGKKLGGFLSNTLDIKLLIDKPVLNLLNLCSAMGAITTTAWVVFLIPHGVSKGFPLSRAVYLASIGGIGNVIGRIAQGPIIHKQWLTSIDLRIILTAVNAVVFLVDPFAKGFAILAVNALIGGLTIGARTTLIVVILKEFTPRDRFF